MKKHLSIVAMTLTFVGSFAAAAYASSSPIAVDSSLNELADAIYNGFKSGNYGELAMAVIVLGVAVLSKYGSQLHSWFGTGHAKRLLLLLGTAAASLYVNGVDAGNVWDAFKLAAMTGGAVSIVQWVAEWLIVRSWVPNWARIMLTGVLWIFRPRGGESIKRAEKAGQAAVKANPPEGVGKTGTLP